MTRPCILFLALAAFGGLAASAATADQPGGHKVIHWEKNATIAYQKAVAQKKPLILFFLCNLHDEKCIHCKRYRASLFSDELGALTDDAIFVQAELDTKNGNRSVDEGAKALFERLGCKSTTVATILEPHPTMIAELARLNGYFNATDLTRHCRDIVSKWRNSGSKLTVAGKN